MIPISNHAKRYQRFAERRRNAHQVLADKSRVKHILLCLLMMFIVGVSVAATIHKSASMEILSTVLLAVLAFTLACFLSFVRFFEIARQHKNAVDAYEANRHNLDVFLTTNVNFETAGTQETLVNLKKIAMELKKIGQTAPRVPDRIWHSVKSVNQTT